MPNLPQLSDDLTHRRRRRRVHNRARHNLHHILRVDLGLQPLPPMLMLRLKLGRSSTMHIPTQEAHPHMVLQGDPLTLLDQPVPLLLMIACCPVVREIVEELGFLVELVEGSAHQTDFGEREHGVEGGVEDLFDKVHPGVGDGDPELDDEMLDGGREFGDGFEDAVVGEGRADEVLLTLGSGKGEQGERVEDSRSVICIMSGG